MKLDSMKIGVALPLIVFLFIFPACCAKKVTVRPEAEHKVGMQEGSGQDEALKREAEKREAAKIREEELAGLREAAEKEYDISKVMINFAFDSYALSEEARKELTKISSWLSKYPRVKIQIEGHCCELGTNDYNLALGEMRSRSAKKYLVALGIDESRISTISYGEEKPIDRRHLEEARAKNRRDQFIITAR